MPSIGFFPSSNEVSSDNFQTRVQGQQTAYWGLVANQRSAYDRLEVGDYIVFPLKGGLKWAGKLVAKFEDKNPLVPDNTGNHMIGFFHSKLWLHSPEGRYAQFVLIMEPVNIPDVTDYREFVLTKAGKHWKEGYPHLAHRVFPVDQCWGLQRLLEQAN